jgi:hypothetical protein
MAQAPKYAPPFEAQFDRDQAQDYVIRKLLRGIHTADLVQVLAVTAGTAAVGFLTVQPVVLDQDTNGLVLAQSPIYNVPFFRYQSGPSAVIMDPVIGDIGLAIFDEKDITGAKARAVEGQALPGAAITDRVHSSADALYVGGLLNGAATQWVKFLPAAAGIDIKTPGALTLEGQTIALTSTGATTINASVLNINCPVNCGSNTITAGDIQLPAGKVNAHNHTGGNGGSTPTGNMQN